MFDRVETAPTDAILGLSEAFKKDPNPEKINLSVGVYQDERATTPTLDSVIRAEQRMLEQQASKAYLPIPGPPEFAAAVQRLLWDDDHEAIAAGRVATSQTPGGTAALRVAGDFIKQNLPHATLWMSRPTWPNHSGVFDAAGVPTRLYAYFDESTNDLDEEAMLADLGQASPGDIVLLHACCHNPTGIDPSPEMWQRIAATLRERQLMPLIDFAYQGFADGLHEDAAGLRELTAAGTEMIVCSSFSKNFGLYSERVGALSILAADAEAVQRVQSQVKLCIRANYSNPPAHGGRIVTTVLEDPGLTKQWIGEVAQMRERINGTRRTFVEALADTGIRRDFSFITRQRGMFSFSGLTPQQVDALRDQYAIYIVRSGRINVAGITRANVQRLAMAIADVVQSSGS
ncbi:MAG: amino acid aminotransferase [Pirellulales bacterium]